MDFIDKIQEISSRISKLNDSVKTEEATKTAFIMPFINALGYDIFNPLEVIPEFTADVAGKKGEKVDYAIQKDDKMIMLIECKWSGSNLTKEHAAQLYRYFTVTEARFGILTNGIIYKFFSDLDEKNKMDALPFFEFDMTKFEQHQINQLKKFAKTSFALDDILDTANNLKYGNAIKQLLQEELDSPSVDFVKLFTSKISPGRLIQKKLDYFTDIIKNAFAQFIHEKVNRRLETALSADESATNTPLAPPLKTAVSTNEDDLEPKENSDNGIVTTDDELTGYHIIRAILTQDIDLNRIVMRDTKSYCGVLLDDNNRKPICRLHFNRPQKYIGLFTEKKEDRIPIDSLNDIFNYSDQLKITLKSYYNGSVE